VRLHDLLDAYLNLIEATVTALPAYAESYVEEVVTSERINLRIRLRFDSGNLLEINEAVTVEADTLAALGYRYHCQNKANVLIFRYDDTPHFPTLPTFPHHKHTRDSVIAHNKPKLRDVLHEAAKEF
jgi:hypothetical protein